MNTKEYVEEERMPDLQVIQRLTKYYSTQEDPYIGSKEVLIQRNGSVRLEWSVSYSGNFYVKILGPLDIDFIDISVCGDNIEVYWYEPLLGVDYKDIYDLVLPRHVWAADEFLRVIFNQPMPEDQPTLHPSLEKVMVIAMKNQERELERLADFLVDECYYIKDKLPEVKWDGEKKQFIKSKEYIEKVNQIKNALDKVIVEEKLEACAQILGIGFQVKEEDVE